MLLCQKCLNRVHTPCVDEDDMLDCPMLDDHDDENIYGLASIRQSVEEDRARRR